MFKIVTMNSQLLDEEFELAGAAMDRAAETDWECLIWCTKMKEFRWYVVPSYGSLEMVCNISYEKREQLLESIQAMMNEWEPKLLKEE